MPLQATSGAASYDAFGGGAAAVPNYIEDVFSTYLYTGTGSAQTITNGVDLSGKGGLVWIKSRSSGSEYHVLQDTVRGRGNVLSSNTTDQSFSSSAGESITTYNSTGFSLGINRNATQAVNTNSATYASWTFRKQPKFFDVVTWTGNNVNGRAISHALNSTPGMILVKCTSNSEAWYVWHRSESTKIGILNGTDAFSTNIGYYQVQEVFGNGTSVIQPTSTDFTVAGYGATNETGRTYVAYLFAHDAGGFGLTGTDNVISCGSFTTDGGGSATVNLGYEPQWLLMRSSSTTDNWYIFDVMRGFSQTSAIALFPNGTSSDYTFTSGTTYPFTPTATGFYTNQTLNGSQTYIYIAIRRGPMKVPTLGTSVFQANTYTGNATANTTVAGNFGFPVDLLSLSNRSADATNWSTYGHYMIDRLRGSEKTSGTANANTESGGWSTYNAFDVQNSIGWGLYGASSNTGYMNNSGGLFVARGFRRAPSFFDEVCYTGTGSATTFTHNLGVVPEMMIVKCRSNGGINWSCYHSALGNTQVISLNEDIQAYTASQWNNTTPTSTVFSVGTQDNVNGSAKTYVAYLFATCAGVSKVGSYTGTGTTLQINCGFTAGSRFVMIKRTDEVASGNPWYVWDSARGIVSGNDPYLLLNSTAAEVTNTDYVDTYSAGFEISSTAPSAINASGGTFIFLAIA